MLTEVVEEATAKPRETVESLEERFTSDTHTALEQPKSASVGNKRGALDVLKLPPPPAFDLFIQSLAIGVPPPERYLPLPVPIPVPRFLLRKKDTAYISQTIIRDVDVKCGSGEVLAMYVP